MPQVFDSLQDLPHQYDLQNAWPPTVSSFDAKAKVQRYQE